ncbi:alkaline phosphatase family protein [Myxococcota bacterium]|nr:alkaline phosphatase family protein [Myxococcota bacterium]
MSTRTLLIGMDGATFTILDEFTRSAEGEAPVMPYLAKMLANGVKSKLLSTPNPLTPPAWVSLMTGRSPGHHGVYDFIRAEERGDDVFFTLYDARDCRTETIWSIASRQDRRIAALNFPFTAPPAKDIDGVMVPGFIPWRHLRRNTRPKGFYDRLKALPGFEAKELAWDFDQEKQALDELSDGDREAWVSYHLPREMQWFRIAEFVLREDAPDLLAVMFDGVDKIQHQAWQFIDPSLEPAEPSEYFVRMRKLCLEYFRQLDGFIEQLVEAAPEDVQVFLASDHGFTATTEVMRINTFLESKGYLSWKEMPDTEAARRREDSMFANLDWADTSAYCRTPSSNGITIRVRGDDGSGGIDPADYEAFRAKLVADLEDWTDPETGERYISEIHRREDVFPGSAMNDAPDLLLVLRDHGFVSIKNKQPAVEPREDAAGTHHPDGVLIGWGKGIRQGVELGRRRIEDVAAILLHSLGLSVPEDFEGRVPEEMFDLAYLEAHPIVEGPATRKVGDDTAGAAMGEDEKDKLMAQLQMLGYME